VIAWNGDLLFVMAWLVIVLVNRGMAKPAKV
jgi:hypothetical protein